MLAHPELIPEEWMYDDDGHPIRIHFFGTRYRDCVDNLVVPYFFYHVVDWSSSYTELDALWFNFDRIPVLAA